GKHHDQPEARDRRELQRLPRSQAEGLRAAAAERRAVPCMQDHVLRHHREVRRQGPRPRLSRQGGGRGYRGMIKALIFDCDGLLVDTERDGHRVGFNRAFEEMGIDAEWDVGLYRKLLLVAGGKERMRAYFDEYGWPAGAETAEAKDDLIVRLHKLKTEITAGLVAEGGLPLRPGVTRIVDEAIAAGVRLGVCTTSNPKFIDAVLDLFGPERKARFEFVHAGDVVARKKPAPDIYQ